MAQKSIKTAIVDISYQETQGTLLLTGTTEDVQSLIHSIQTMRIFRRSSAIRQEEQE